MKRARLAPVAEVPQLDGVVAAWPGEAQDLDGTSIFVRRAPARSPAAQPAVYVHGLGGSSLNWTDLAALLAHRLDGEAIDLPGFGRSDPADRYSIAAMAHRVIRWIEQSGRGPVHLFGNSLGGVITVRVAATRPDLVRTLTLISPAMPFLDPRRSEHAMLVPILFLPGAARLVARRLAATTPEALARDVINVCFADPSRLPPQRFEEAVEEVRRRCQVPWYVPAYLGSMRGLVSAYLRAYLPGANSLWRMAATITVPTLVITGRLDRIVDVRVAPAVASVIPDSRLMVVDDVGHLAQMEVPRLIARAVLGLMDETPQTSTEHPPLRSVRYARPRGFDAFLRRTTHPSTEAVSP
jgi:pimeloyl-ACP methyl ester carboxylesterase